MKVYEIRDNERHHYAADSAWGALRCHQADHEGEEWPGETLEVTPLGDEDALTIHFNAMGDIPAVLRDRAVSRDDIQHRRHSVTATCAEWIAADGRIVPYQLSSTVF
jgi:hypothetical protein